MKINFKSEKGAAIVLVAVMVTGVVMLVSVIAIENLRRSTELSGVQKRSLDSLYKAEEGAEYGLFVNKEKTQETAVNLTRPFNISLWEKGTDIKKGEQALEQLAQPIEGRNIVITSQSNNNDNLASRKTIFTNLPSKYQNQVPLWNIREGCSGECGVTYEENEMEPSRFQVVVSSAVFEKSSWNGEEMEYRLVFKCGESSYWQGSMSGTENIEGCRVGDVNISFDGCVSSQCKIEGCTYSNSVNFANGESSMEGKIIPTEWFQVTDPGSGTKLNLTSKDIVVEFELLQGTMEEITFSEPQENIQMCKQNDTSWQEFRDRRGGISGFEVRKAEGLQ